jgi:hypothetical protein
MVNKRRLEDIALSFFKKGVQICQINNLTLKEKNFWP